MAREVLLDTSVLIAIVRGELDPRRAYDPTDEPAISALTAAELLVGVELAPTEREQIKRQKVNEILASLYVVDYDLRVARIHALLMAHSKRTGKPRGSMDLAIAATAVAHRRVLVTADTRASFDDLPGLDVDVVGQR